MLGSAIVEGEFPGLRDEAPEAATEVAFALLDALWDGPVGLAVLDQDLRLVHLNETIVRATGLQPGEHAGRTVRDIGERVGCSADAIAGVEEAIGRVVASGCPVTGRPLSLTLADGRRHEWLYSLFPVAREGGPVRGVCALVTDATEERERQAATERARACAERNARHLTLVQEVTAALSAADDPRAVADVVADKLRVAFGADAAWVCRVEGSRLRLVGQRGLPAGSAEELGDVPLGSGLATAVAAREGRAIWIESVREVADRRPEMAEAARAHGREALAVVPLASNRGMAGVLGMAFARPRRFDLEERALVLALAQQCAQALERAALLERERVARAEAERNRAVLDALLQNAPVGFAFLDRDLRFHRVNPLLAELNGLPAEAHLGRTLGELFPALPHDDLERMGREVLDTGRPVLDREVVGETPAAPGRRRTWLESWYPVRAGGETLGLGAIVREVTAEREAIEFQRNVLGIVGHDLRNPLSALVLSARMLVSSPEIAPGRSRLASRIFSIAGRMERIIATLVDYARLGAGQPMPLDRRRCDVAEVVEAVAEECEASHPGRTVRRHGDGDAACEWDSARIAEALANLVGNALDYSPPDSPVEVAWRAEPARVTIEVSNQGPPIPADVLPRLFEPFRRAERERPGGRDGLGLGLFIARAIAGAHGGRIEARSTPGAATVFAMTLPRVAAEAARRGL